MGIDSIIISVIGFLNLELQRQKVKVAHPSEVSHHYLDVIERLISIQMSMGSGDRLNNEICGDKTDIGSSINTDVVRCSSYEKFRESMFFVLCENHVPHGPSLKRILTL